MRKKLALSLMFVFTLALTAPVMANTMIQEPEKKENCEKKVECTKTKAECSEAKKAECDKTKKAECDKATKKECCDKAK